jgi:hypothetical protein
MAYYKVRIEVWCDWNPAEGDLDDIVQSRRSPRLGVQLVEPWLQFP